LLWSFGSTKNIFSANYNQLYKVTSKQIAVEITKDIKIMTDMTRLVSYLKPIFVYLQ
jgi:hypothetical protein